MSISRVCRYALITMEQIARVFLLAGPVIILCTPVVLLCMNNLSFFHRDWGIQC